MAAPAPDPSKQQQQPQPQASAAASGGDAAAAAEAAAYHGFDHFAKAHGSQLRGMGLPEHLWAKLHAKIYGEQFDATDTFRVEWGDGIGFRLVCNAQGGAKAHGDVWLIEHAFTTTAELYKPTLRQHPDLLQRLWKSLDLDRRSKGVSPVWSTAHTAADAKAAPAPAPAADAKSGAGAGPAADVRTVPAAGEDRGQLTDSDVSGMVEQLMGVVKPQPQRDAALKALIAADYDLITAIAALTADDASTAALEKEVTNAFEQSVAAQTKYQDTAAPAAPPTATAAAATGAAGAGAVDDKAKAAAAARALDDRIDLFWRCCFRLQDIGSYVIRDPRAPDPNEPVQCLFLMDQIGCAIQPPASAAPLPGPAAPTAAATTTATTAAKATANAAVAPLCLVTIPDLAYSVLWLTRDVAFDECVTRDFTPVELVA